MAGLESVEPIAQQPAERHQVSDQARRADSPWLDAGEAVDYLRLGSRRALTRAMADQRLPYHRLGRNLRFYIPELDAWLLNSGTGVPVTGVQKVSA